LLAGAGLYATRAFLGIDAPASNAPDEPYISVQGGLAAPDPVPTSPPEPALDPSALPSFDPLQEEEPPSVMLGQVMVIKDDLLPVPAPQPATPEAAAPAPVAPAAR
jgi:hypothetical protein